MYFILQALYYALPIYTANMVPVLVRGIPILQHPIDGGRMWKNKPILGKNKTWRGLLSGIIAGLLMAYLQRYAQGSSHFFAELSIFDYELPSALALGACMGAGALLGDALKSFAKRRVGIASGQPWVPFDQIDLIVGGLLLSSLVFWPGWKIAVVLLFLTPVLHALTNFVSYKIGLKEVPW